MPSFSDSIFLFVLALLLFGPKKLPVLARELGKWVGEFRRASNEFKMQMEEELRQTEQAERQKQITAMETAAPVTPPIEEPEHPHLPSPAAENFASSAGSQTDAPTDAQTGPLPIASSGELKIMPPATGLPTPRGAPDPLGGLLNSIPTVEAAPDRSEDSARAMEAEADVHAR